MGRMKDKGKVEMEKSAKQEANDARQLPFPGRFSECTDSSFALEFMQ